MIQKTAKKGYCKGIWQLYPAWSPKLKLTAETDPRRLEPTHWDNWCIHQLIKVYREEDSLPFSFQFSCIFTTVCVWIDIPKRIVAGTHCGTMDMNFLLLLLTSEGNLHSSATSTTLNNLSYLNYFCSQRLNTVMYCVMKHYWGWLRIAEGLLWLPILRKYSTFSPDPVPSFFDVNSQRRTPDSKMHGYPPVVHWCFLLVGSLGC